MTSEFRWSRTWSRSTRTESCSRSGFTPTPVAEATSRSFSSAARATGPATSRITNRRWVLSAFGTASSAALSEGDTVYSLTPIYHPSGLMMSFGGAIAGGARLAMASRFEPSTFWEETRRYGVTVASYTWTMLHDLVEAPPQPGERHHPVRLFIGSGMPRGLWRRVQERFTPARVLEFYASTEAGAILVNLTGAKVGSMGRPLPGSTDVRIAAYGLKEGGLLLRPDGFARECKPDEVGMLMARVRPDEQLSMIPLRGVFASEDAWLLTGDLFRKDDDGDFWRINNLAELIETAGGPVFAGPICDALGDLPCVDLVVAYGVPARGGKNEVAVAALTLRTGQVLHAKDIAPAFERSRPRSMADDRACRRADPGDDLVSPDDRAVARSGNSRARARRPSLAPRSPRPELSSAHQRGTPPVGRTGDGAPPRGITLAVRWGGCTQRIELRTRSLHESLLANLREMETAFRSLANDSVN